MTKTGTRNRPFIPILIAGITGLVLAVASCQSPGGGAGEEAGGSAVVDLAMKSSQGEVSFDLTPRSAPGGGLEVALRVNTHSGDLSQIDLRNVVALEAEGRTYKPVEASTLQGHHATGTVRFAVDDFPDRFVITISGVRGMPAQRFEWP
jgi:hypothetical protein